MALFQRMGGALLVIRRDVALAAVLALDGCSGQAQLSAQPSGDAGLPQHLDAAQGDTSTTAVDATSDALAFDATSDAPVLEAETQGDAACGPWVTDVQTDDAGGLPQGSCGPRPVACQSSPRVTFSCPIVRGPADSGAIAPGDTVTVTVPLTSTVGLGYPCFGLTADHGVAGTTPGVSIYYLSPTQGYPLTFTVQLPASLAPGTVVHFVAYVVLSPCPGDTGAIGFDVVVG
jgi:hypothetical protein